MWPVGGANVWPAEADGKPSGGGKETCCSDIPSVWQPDLRLTVRWLVDKKQDGKTRGSWYKAENVRIPKYGRVMGGLWAVFLPGDRVRIMVADGQKGDANDPGIRPSDNDPYIAQGCWIRNGTGYTGMEEVRNESQMGRPDA
ncbi:DUF3304 domain-containing protein [Burkholderia ubonensis]|uniref:DUF3304 domain-containing protein n=1 Tax=Burkholderia ubonensis TaxID=101571 RepID=UPI000AD7F2A6